MLCFNIYLFMAASAAGSFVAVHRLLVGARRLLSSCGARVPESVGSRLSSCGAQA